MTCCPELCTKVATCRSTGVLLCYACEKFPRAYIYIHLALSQKCLDFLSLYLFSKQNVEKKSDVSA